MSRVKKGFGNSEALQMLGRERKINANASAQTYCYDILGYHRGLVEDSGHSGGDAVLF